MRKTQNLISGDIDEAYLKRKEWEGTLFHLITGLITFSEKNNFDETVVQILSYWKGNLTLNLVTDHSQFPEKTIPPQMLKRTDLSFHNRSSVLRHEIHGRGKLPTYRIRK